jgi:glycerol-3-phosphate dehydrogenase
MKYDIVIIGAGISGAAIASALSRYARSICVLEKSNDVSNGASKANSGIVHAGYDARPGTLMAHFNILGNRLYPELCRRLHVPYAQRGSLVLAFDDRECKTLLELKQRGKENGIKDLRILTGEEVLEREPKINPEVKCALYAPDAGIVSPYELTIALMEHAMDNGVDLFTETEVLDIKKDGKGYVIRSEKDEFHTACVINCAGVYADNIHNMLLPPAFSIRPRRGEYFLLDKYVADIVNHVIFQCPSEAGKGVLIAPTVHNNVIVGPNAEQISDREGVETTLQGLSEVWQTALKTLPQLPKEQIITTFSGVRAEPDSHDFIIKHYEKEAPGFIDVAGIKSPGLTAAPAFANYVKEMVLEYFITTDEKKNYQHERRPHLSFHERSPEERNALVRQDPRYGRIICRCEGVTEAEIVDVIHRNAGARTLDGVKRRVRCGGGRCQGGFCGPRIIEILSRELNIPAEQIRKDSGDSRIITGETPKGKSADERI